MIDREESFFCAEEISRGQYAGTRGFLEVILKIELQRLSEIELPAVHRGLMDPPVRIFRERHAVCAPLQAVGDDVFGKQPVKFSGIPSVVDGVGPPVGGVPEIGKSLQPPVDEVRDRFRNVAVRFMNLVKRHRSRPA